MRWLTAVVLIITLLIIIVPTLMVRGLDFRMPPYQSKRDGIMLNVYLHEQDKVVEMNLEEYVKGVVAAEMPAEFESEALKSQAVAARTYAVRQMRSYGGSGSPQHPKADISTNPSEGQAWLSEEALKNKWGKLNYSRYWSKIARAVEETGGSVMTYNGEIINALFHSTSGGQTEDPWEVWGQKIPYLKSVPCPWDKNSPRYKGQKTFSISELEERLGPDASVVTVAQNGKVDLAQVVEKTVSGRIKKVRIGSKVFAGMAVREKLGLFSTNFSWTIDTDKVHFSTIGYGHGVGMSQYGANGLAKEGRKHQEILQYFYQGVEFTTLGE